MDSESENLEAKLTTLLSQLQTECGIFERMVYKNKNQHRRCSYFQYLLKVRRDLKLLESANLREILDSCFQVISGKRAKQKVHLLESLKRRKIAVGNFNFLERLLGVARLLAQMVEPMLKAATEISVVLARTFFMGFSLTILALLARIRVLVQQILLDVVSVFNMVSSLSQSKQSVKINGSGLEIFREVFPTKDELVVLECVWKSDKFVLVERTHVTPIPGHELEGQTSSKESSAVRYLTVESFLGEDETPNGDEQNPKNEKGLTHMLENTVTTDSLLLDQSAEDSDDKSTEDRLELRDPSCPADTPSKKLSESSSLSPSNNKPPSRKVAFVAVKNPAPSTSNVAGNRSKVTGIESGNKEDSFFSLLAAGSTKESLF